MEILNTARLLIRPFVDSDLSEIHRILSELFDEPQQQTDLMIPTPLAVRAEWLRWNSLNAHWFPNMHQPPYGDRAVVLRTTGELIGSVGYVPLLAPFDQIPELARTSERAAGRRIPEVGLFWAIDPRHQRLGYATEAGAALIDYAFARLHLWRILATTEYDNLASQAVMRKLGMTLAHNPLPDPPWLQIVGLMEATRMASG